LYTSVGTRTCEGRKTPPAKTPSDTPGSIDHFQQDANTFAKWGVDYVKLDYCGDEDSVEGHKNFSKALNATGRPIVLELCRGPYQRMDHWGYAPDIAQIWRATGDHHDNWDSVKDQYNSMTGKSEWSKSFGWAYGDMMMTGGEGCEDWGPDSKPSHCPKMTDEEYRTETSTYAVMGSPMLIGTDIRDFTPIMEELMLNAEMLEINQDYLAVPGDVVKDGSCGEHAYRPTVRKLTDGRLAVAITNEADEAHTLVVCMDKVGWTSPEANVRDVWGKTDFKATGGTFTVSGQVKKHDTKLFILSKVSEAIVV